MKKDEASPLRRAAMQGLQIALTLGLVAWIVRRIGLRTLTERLLAADPWWLAMSIGAFVLSLILGTLQWDRLLRHQGVRLRFLEALRIYVLGMFLNGVLPSGVGGDVVRAIQVQREARRGGTGLAATFLDRFAGLFSLALFAFVASLILQAGEHDPVFERLVGLIGLAFVSFCAVAAVLFSRRATAWLEPVARLLGEGRIRDLMRDLRRAFLHYRTSGPLVWQVVVLSLSVQLLRILVHYHASNALGLGIGLGWFMLFVPLVALVSVLPISVGGWGPREGLQQYLFALPGVMTAVPAAQASASALALALLTSLLGLLIPAGLGIVLGLSNFRSVRHARRREPLAT